MRLSKMATGVLCSVCIGAWFGWIICNLSIATACYGVTINARVQSIKAWEKERERAYNRELFNKSFRELQLIGQRMLKDHEGGRLTTNRLAKDSKSINKCAKTLRSLTALGSLAEPQEVNKDIDTPQEYDESIRRLARHIWDFAHNPVHQNSKVFNTDQAGRAQTDLLAIINLSKAIENKAKGYATLPVPAQ